jgi:hypothetical protein
MPQVRSLLLFQQMAPIDATYLHWWLAECYATSDGPRMRLLAPHPTEEAARAEMDRREGIITPQDTDALRQAYDSGVRDGMSRARSSPGNGDMGG